jgi:hypothetical protein
MRLTLLSDGPTDQALLPLLRWLIHQHSTQPFEQSWANLRRLRRPPSRLIDRVPAALDLYLVMSSSFIATPSARRQRNAFRKLPRLPWAYQCRSSPSFQCE